MRITLNLIGLDQQSSKMLYRQNMRSTTVYAFIYSFYQRAKRSFRKHWSRQEIDPTNDLINLNNINNLDIINDCDGGSTTVCILKDETLLLTNGNTASAIPIKVRGHS